MDAVMHRQLFGLLFPTRCLLCGREIPGGKTLCASCAKSFPRAALKQRVAFPGAGAEGLRILAPFPYEGGFRETMHRFKFRNEWALAKPIAAYMAQALREDGAEADCLCWVPMTKEKKRLRGYDQSELLAKETARRRKLAWEPLLRKKRETAVQHELSARERERNLLGAYEADRRAAGRRIVLVDDIVTTGSTLKECAAALYGQGAAQVVCLCAARTC